MERRCMASCRQRRRNLPAATRGATGPRARPATGSTGPEGSTSLEPALLCSARSAHHDIFVYQAGPNRWLTFDPTDAALEQSAIDANDPRRVIGSYRHALIAAVALHGAPTRVLCLGVGGGSVPMAVREVFPTARVDAVDIDDEVIRIARDWFGLSGDDGLLRLHTADARSFVRRACAQGQRWDVILQDTYDRHYIPPHLMTAEFFRELGAVLDAGGLAATNSFAHGHFHDRELATHAEAFVDFWS